MQKKFTTVIAIMLIFFLSACEAKDKEIISENVSYSQETEDNTKDNVETIQESSNFIQKAENITAETVDEEENGPINKNNKTVDISIDDVKGISESDATQLCIDALGIISEMTGFKKGYRPIGAVEHKGRQYYVMYVAWLVDGSRWSYIGHHLVSAGGDVIYDCAIGQDGTYYVSRKLWQNSDNNLYTKKFVNDKLINENNKTVDILTDDIKKGISAPEASQLCKDTIGVVDEMTGSKAKYRPVGAVEYKGRQYYVIYAAWYIDDVTWSFIGYNLVSAGGDEIYDSTIGRDGFYYVGEKLWQK